MSSKVRHYTHSNVCACVPTSINSIQLHVTADLLHLTASTLISGHIIWWLRKMNENAGTDTWMMDWFDKRSGKWGAILAKIAIACATDTSQLYVCTNNLAKKL